MSDERVMLLRRERGEAVQGDFSKYDHLQQALGDRKAAAKAPAGFEDKLWAAVDAVDDGEQSPGANRNRLALWGGVAVAAAALFFGAAEVFLLAVGAVPFSGATAVLLGAAAAATCPAGLEL